MRGKKLAFGSRKSRPLYTEGVIYTRFGLQHCPFTKRSEEAQESDQNNADTQVTEVVHGLVKMECSNLGYCVRTAPRFSSLNKLHVPSPAEYQRHKQIAFTRCGSAKPFNAGGSRFKKPVKSDVPGPGSYYNDNTKEVKSEKQDPVFPVYIKCCVANTDQCGQCKKTPKGDYFKRKDEVFCKECYLAQKNHARDMTGFRKIRDCTFMHDHHGAATIKQLLEEKLMLKTSGQVVYEKLGM